MKSDLDGYFQIESKRAIGKGGRCDNIIRRGVPVFLCSLLHRGGRHIIYPCSACPVPTALYCNDQTAAPAIRQLPRHFQVCQSLPLVQPRRIELLANPTSTWPITVLILPNGSTFRFHLDVMCPDQVSLRVYPVEVDEERAGGDQR